MTKKEKKKDTMTGVAVSGIMGVSMTGAVSGATGYGAGISSNYATGVSNVGKVLPVYGKIKGTRMVLKPIGKLKKTTSKLFKGAREL